MKQITVIHCWSAPRSRSTALLYSFEARGEGDTVAIDEPLYREWLVQRGDSVSRPYRENLITGTPPDGSTAQESAAWRRELLSFEDRLRESAELLPNNGVIFAKHMAKHSFLYNFEKEISGEDLNVAFKHKHLLLVRDPVAVLSSWGAAASNHGNVATPDEVGVVPLLGIYSTIQSRINASHDTVVVLDSDDLVRDPSQVLAAICSELDISYSSSMLTWKSGSHACDGPWAKHWYHDVWKSSGWKLNAPQYGASRYRTLDPILMEALTASFPAYDFLIQLTKGYKDRGPPSEKINEDARNANLLIWIGAPGRGRICPRSMAGVSPYDSIVQVGDVVREGLRIDRGKILLLEKHLRRLFKAAHALGFHNVHGKAEIIEAIFRTLAANGMRDDAQIHLMLTRGEQYASGMDPRHNVYGTTLIVQAEWITRQNTQESGISLITSSQRQISPKAGDSSNVLSKIEANLAGCADAVMLDGEGFVSETNVANIFLVDNGLLITPPASHKLPDVSRAAVLALADELGIKNVERRVSLAELHSAEEVFTSSATEELVAVTSIDSRTIGDGKPGPLTGKLQELYKNIPDRPGWATEIPAFESAL